MYKKILAGSLELIKQKVKNIRDAKYSKFYPTNPRHDDLYIVEFPKSGITWLTTLMANVNILESNEKVNITFYNIHQYIPDIHTSQTLHENPLWSYPKFRMIKSHNIYNKNYNFVIYLIRDPLKVMNSFYIFKTQLGQFKGTFEEFVKNKSHGIESWIRHTTSWLCNGTTPQRVHLVRYEDLISNPYNTIDNLYKNIGLNISKDILEKAINLSDMNNMQITEESNNINNPNNTNFVFVGKGKITYKQNMNDEIKQYIENRLKDSVIYNTYYKDKL